MTPSRALTAAFLSAAVALQAGCSRSEPGSSAATATAPASPSATPAPRVPPGAHPNLLLVTLDTTRGDHLGCYGDAQAETPTLDRLAKEGLLVEHATAVAPLTLPSHASILTGLYPPRHGARDNADFRLPDSETTLAEHLRSQGYATEAVVGSFVLSSAAGLQQGFERYDEPRGTARVQGKGKALMKPVLERPAAEVTDAAIGALGRVAEKPFFLWVHYYDPHQPYAPPEPYASRFLARPYDGEIAYEDAQLGRLLEELGRRGLRERTLVVVTADHGEGLGDHGEETHGIFLYDSVLRVPLLVSLPGVVPAGRRTDRVVSGIDLVPTVLDLMGLPPLPGVQGVSFARTARGATEAPREPAYAEAINPERVYGWAPTFSLRDVDWKFIEAPEPELYDLRADPGERKNLAPVRAEEAKDWSRRLGAVVAALGSPDASAESPMDKETRERLASLGYVSGGSGAVRRGTRPDPKRLVAVHQKFLGATTLVSQGRPQEALALLREALAVDPENPAVLTLAGTLAFSMGESDKALGQLQSAARAAPGVYDNQWNLANALFLLRKLPEASRAYRAAIAVQPRSPDARYGLARTLHAMNDTKGAVKEYEEAIGLGLSTPKIHAGLGVALAASGDVAGAEKELRAAVEADPSLAEAWNKLGILAAQAGRNAEARDFFSGAVQADPDNADALFNHARASMLIGDRKSAERDVALLTAKHPRYPETWFLKARILASGGDREGAKAVLKEFLSRSQGADPALVHSAQEMLKKLGG